MKLTTRKIWLIVAGAIVIALLSVSGKLIEFVDNSEYVIIQGIGGGIHVYKEAGPVWQGFGTATHYKKSNQLWFSKLELEGDTVDQSIKVRFNDGGHGTISGSIRWYMPTDDKSIIKLHTDFASQEAVEKQLVQQTITKSIYMSGPLMSSKESAAEKRPTLLTYIEDQAINGIYVTRNILANDSLEKDKTVVEIIMEKGVPKRRKNDDSKIKEYGIVMNGLVINSIDYSDEVEAQIRQQQQLTMAVQTSKANAIKSTQDAITTEQKGKADAAKAKWDQEVIKAKAVTEAQQNKEVAELDAQTALAYARKVKTEADADAYANAKMVAAGLTPQERAEWEMKTKVGVAEAISKITLPTTYFSGGSNAGKGSASMLESILGAKLLEMNASSK